MFLPQALEVIRELQKHFPIKRSPMRVRLTMPGQNSSVSEKLSEWHASIISKEESGNQLSIVSPHLVAKDLPLYIVAQFMQKCLYRNSYLRMM